MHCLNFKILSFLPEQNDESHLSITTKSTLMWTWMQASDFGQLHASGRNPTSPESEFLFLSFYVWFVSLLGLFTHSHKYLVCKFVYQLFKFDLIGFKFWEFKRKHIWGGGGRNFFISNLLSIAWKVREVKVHPATVSDSLSVILSRLSTMINRWEEGHSVNIFIPSLSRLTGIFYSTKVNFKGKFQ